MRSVRLWPRFALVVSLASGCFTRVVERPVAVPAEPCLVAPWPAIPEEVAFEACGSLVCTTVNGARLLEAWLVAVHSWRDSVLSCPSVSVTPVANTGPVK